MDPLADVTEERLANLEARTRDSRFGLVPGDEPSPMPPRQDEVLDLIAALREARAQRDACAAEAAALRAGLTDLLDYQANGLPMALEPGWSGAIRRARAALSTPPTAWAAVAATRARVCAADRALNPFWTPDSERWVAAETERRAALIALRAAEAAAKGDAS